MSRFKDYNNIYDAEDDGEDFEITEEEVEASDDQGREEAATLVRTGRSIRGTGKYDEQQRRMWFRWAKKALAEGAERGEEAAAAERAQREAEEREEQERVAEEGRAAKARRKFERHCAESDARWARLNEETARLEAEWKAGAPERERAAREVAARMARMPSPSPSGGAMRSAASPPSATRAVEQAQTPKPRPRSTTLAIPTVCPPEAAKLGAGASPTTRSGAATGSLQPPSQLPARPTTDLRRAVKPPRVEIAPRPAPAYTPRSAAPRSPAPPPSAPSAAVSTARLANQTAPANPAPLSAQKAAVPLNGADLVRWRTAGGLTQRAAAEVLGVAPSTVAKAELLPAKALGEALVAALRPLLGR